MGMLGALRTRRPTLPRQQACAVMIPMCKMGKSRHREQGTAQMVGGRAET